MITGHQLEQVNCPLCDSANYRKLFTGQDYLFSQENFTVVRCIDCGLHFTNPRVKEDQITHYYYPEYTPYKNVRESTYFPKVKSWLSRQAGSTHWEIHRMLQSVGARAVLEIGPGNGSLLKFLQDKGFSVAGIETDQNCVHRIRDHNIICHHGRLEDVYKDLNEFDAVICCHVLEHLYQPHKTLKIIGNILTDKGFVFISIPNIGSVEAKVFGRYWRGLDMPRHIVHYNKETISALLAKTGFKIIQIKDQIFPSSLLESIGHKYFKNRQLPGRYYYPLYYFWKLLAPFHHKIIGSGIIDIFAVKNNER